MRTLWRAVRVVLIVFVLCLIPFLVRGQDIGPLPQAKLSGGWIAGAVYVLLLLMIEYVPKAAEWWNAFEYKRSAVAGAGLVIVIALVSLHYAGAFNLDIGPFGWHVIGQAFNAWLAFLGGGWAIWSVLERAGALPRKQQRWVEEDGDGGRASSGREC
jgi:uncharacterized membrane protein